MQASLRSGARPCHQVRRIQKQAGFQPRTSSSPRLPARAHAVADGAATRAPLPGARVAAAAAAPTPEPEGPSCSQPCDHHQQQHNGIHAPQQRRQQHQQQQGPPLRGGALATAALVASAACCPGAAHALIAEPSNALSLPTWAIHVSSVAEWVLAIALFWRYAEVSGNPRWKGLSWGMLPALGSAMSACTWHFFYNSPDLDDLVALQAGLTVVGNATCWLAAYRIYTAAKEAEQA